MTIRASKTGLEIIEANRELRNWNKTSAKWFNDANVSLSTLKRFRSRVPIDRDAFIAICKAIGVNNWQDIVDETPLSIIDFKPDFFGYNDNWVGQERDLLVTELSQKLRLSCRLLVILGITGIGKTTLAEKLAVELEDWIDGDWNNCWRRANFDYEGRSTDFASVATEWLEGWGEILSSEDRKPERLLERLVKYLCEHQVLVLVDSLESLLTGTNEGWGDFADDWWRKFFLRILSAVSCKSRLIITSQDLPVDLLKSRYSNFWHREILYGLSKSEQVDLFETAGLDMSEDSPDRSILLRIGKVYQGHPLVLRVMIGEILSKPFNGNVQAYWNDTRENTSQKIEDVEKALREAAAGINLGEQDDWKLHEITKEVREKVNKQRLQITFDRLERDVKDAYILICAASVYRTLEKEEFWRKHLFHWIKRLEKQECTPERSGKAIEELENRFLLIEESSNVNGKRIIGQHNLIRSIAIERRINHLPGLINRRER